MFGPVVSGQFVFGGLVETDPDIPVGGSVLGGDVVFGGEPNRAVLFVGVEIGLLLLIVRYAWTWPTKNPSVSTMGRAEAPHQTQPSNP